MPPITTVAIGLDVASIVGILYSPMDTTLKIVIICLCIAQNIAFFFRWCRDPGVVGNFLSIFFMYGGNAAMIGICGVTGIWPLLIPVIISCGFKVFYDILTNHG